jgi:hypothetical protein
LDFQSGVSRISNPHLRVDSGGFGFRRSAGWKPAIRQVGNLRYGVLVLPRPFLSAIAFQGARGRVGESTGFCFPSRPIAGLVQSI